MTFDILFSISFAFPSEDFSLRFSFSLVSWFVCRINCCVALMSSLLVTVSSDFHVKPKRNKLMVAHQAATFICLVSSWQVYERIGHKLTHEYLLGKKNMAENEIRDVSA